MKVSIQYNVLEWKVTVFCTIYFPGSSYPVLVFVFVQNNHDCLSMIQSIQYKTLSKAVLQYRERKADHREWLEHYNLCKEWNYTRHP